jgi:hypothetical protein
VKACALPVEKVAVPISNFADSTLSLSLTIPLLALSNNNLAAPARIWTLPWSSVLSRSPPNTVVPIDVDLTLLYYPSSFHLRWHNPSICC